MNRQGISTIDNIICRLQEATANTLETVAILFDSRARDEEEKRLYLKIADDLPDLRKDVAALSALKFSDKVDDKYSISYMIDIVKELSDRFVALKVLLNDLVPLLTARNFAYGEVSPYFPYLSVLLEQIERNRGNLSTWYEEDFDFLRDRFEYDLKENENFQIIRSFVDRCLKVYANNRNNPAIVNFHDYALDALDRFADGDDDVSFTFSFENGDLYRNPGDVEKVWIEFRIDGSIDVSMSDYVIGLCGGDSELLWSYSLYGNSKSVGVNGLSEHRPEDIGRWKLSIENPDEFYYYEDTEEDDEAEREEED